MVLKRVLVEVAGRGEPTYVYAYVYSCVYIYEYFDD